MPPPPLPWTDDFLRTATVEDLRQISDDNIRALDDEKMEDLEAKLLVRKAQRDLERQVERDRRQGRTPAPPKPIFAEVRKNREPLIQVVEERGWEDIGFYRYFTVHLEEAVHRRWADEFDRIAEGSVRESGGTPEFLERMIFPSCFEPNLRAMTWGELRDEHEETQADNDYGEGVAIGVFLVIDAESAESLLTPKSEMPPWVWVVDERFGFDSAGTIPEGQYRGYFKVAIESLLPDLYPLVATGTPLRELWTACPFDDQHPVWTNAFGL